MVCRRGEWGWDDCRTGLNLLKVLRWELFSFIALSTRTISCSITISMLIWFPDKKGCIVVPLAESVLHSLDCSRNRLNWPSSLYNLFQVFSSSTWTSCGTLQKKKLFLWLKRYSRLVVHLYLPITPNICFSDPVLSICNDQRKGLFKFTTSLIMFERSHDISINNLINFVFIIQELCGHQRWEDNSGNGIHWDTYMYIYFTLN